ncbi:MAG TPA: PadR family transcriptional regulator [Methanomicrobia archaeon]|nr:PadR family transcriptional regulator [Methanomicrobia archaeon]
MIRPHRLLKLYLLWVFHKGPKCGYDIKKELEEMTEHKALSNAVIYLRLKELERKGLIEGSQGSRNKTIYAITAKGEEELEKERVKTRHYLLKFQGLLEFVLDAPIGGTDHEST